MDVTQRLIRAFPSGVRGEAEHTASELATAGATLSPYSFEVVVNRDRVAIPERLYADVPALSERGGPIAACLMTRHHSGFIRQQALETVLVSKEPWVIPFVVRLVGEYVIEIIQLIDDSFDYLPAEPLRDFVFANPEFIRLTRARVASYWNCYYRTTPRREHVAFRVMERIEATATK
jgi:hypothetical protein